MDKRNIQVLIAVGIVVVLGGTYWLYAFFSSRASQPINNTNTTTTANSTTSSSTKSKTAIVSQKLSYASALKLYAGKRIQFNEGCIANPNYTTLKKGDAIMLDNRSNKAKVIALDTHRYNIKALDFIIVATNADTVLPHTILINCDKGKGNASIVLE